LPNFPPELRDHLPEDWEKFLEECSDNDCEAAWTVVRSNTLSRSTKILPIYGFLSERDVGGVSIPAAERGIGDGDGEYGGNKVLYLSIAFEYSTN
jgi:hypothetical protein